MQGNKVTAKIGGNLNIETLQEKETYEEKNTSAGFNLSWDIRAGKFSKPTFGLSAGRGTIDSHYRSARGQSGIFAGKSGFDIYVEKNTDLKGAVIASEATAGKNRLSTGTFSFSDLENEADYNSKSIGAEYHHYGSYDKMGRQEKNKVYNTIGLSPSLSMPAKGDANSTTTSAVAPGTIKIRENPAQDISALNRNTENALNELGRIFDKEKIEEQQELAKVFGEEAFRLAHNLSDDGSGRKVAVHAIIGGIMSQITSAGFASGAIGAGVNEAIIGGIKKIKDPGTAQIVSAIVGAAAAKAIGGNVGAGATSAASGTKNNSLITQFDFIRDGIRNNNWVYELPEGHCVYSLYSVGPTTIMTIIFNVDGMPVFSSYALGAGIPTLPIGGSFGQGFFMNSKRELVTDPEEIKKEMAGFSDGWTLNILAEGGISTNLNGYQLICYGIGSTPGASLSAGWTFYEGSKDDF